MRDLIALRDKLTREREEIQGRIAHVQMGEQRETAGHQTDNAHEWENAEIRDGLQAEARDEFGSRSDWIACRIDWRSART